MAKEKKELREMSKKEKRIFVLILSVIIIIVVVLVRDKDTEDNETVQKTYTKIEAYSASQQFVEGRLKAPSTASFNYDPDKIMIINDTTFNVIASVDAENSFGAKIRKNYQCKIIFLPHINQVRCEDLRIE